MIGARSRWSKLGWIGERLAETPERMLDYVRSDRPGEASHATKRGSYDMKTPLPDVRNAILEAMRTLKMARSAHGYATIRMTALRMLSIASIRPLAGR